jgi:radical SAM protein with 4Fe4S-binding SPASM domain
VLKIREFVCFYIKVQLQKITIKEMMKYLGANNELFSAIEVETINRCNGACSFCPVNAKVDKRSFAEMDEGLFCKIIDELGRLNYSNFLGLQSNNEPFLDKHIITKIAYARQRCPEAFIYMYTNGTLLNAERLLKSIDAGLSEILINNYNDNMVLNDNIKDIAKNLERPEYEIYRKKVKIAIRKKTEVLTNRGGLAPNKNPKEYRLYKYYRNAACLLPFRQIVVRPTGEISLCCQDALGQVTLGDVKRQGLKEIWEGPSYKRLREQLIKGGRKSVKVCRVCDVAGVYRNDFSTLLHVQIKKHILSIQKGLSVMSNLIKKIYFASVIFLSF